ncbi:MAG: hypothetical protein DRJ03_31515, partial [Chloroflexi bacterium]
PEMLTDGASVYLVGHDTLGQWDGSTWAYHLPDALGSVRQVVDGAGAVVSAREWSPYGVELALSGVEGVGAAQAGLGYTGEWFDADVGLEYLRARWYDGQTGRFVSKDLWVGEFGPQAINRHVYVLNRPVNATDPTGMICIFGYGNCDEDPDIGAYIATLPYRIIPGDFCLPGNLGCWGGEKYADWLANEYYPSFPEQNYWLWHNPAEAWGLAPPEEDLRTLLIQDWFFEQGASRRDFDESYSATQALMNHDGVQRYRSEFYRSGCYDIGDRNNPDDHGKWYSPGDNTALDRLVGESDLDRLFLEFKCEGVVGVQIIFQTEYNQASICGTLGSYAVKITNNHDGTANFEVYNPTSRESFLRPPFDWMPTLGRPEREETSPNWFCPEMGCGGNMYQYFHWTEDIPPGVCGGCP